MNEIRAAKRNDDTPRCEFRIAGYDEPGAHLARSDSGKLGVAVGREESWTQRRTMSGARFSPNAEMTRRFFGELRAEIAAKHPTWNETEQKNRIRRANLWADFGRSFSAKFGEASHL